MRGLKKLLVMILTICMMMCSTVTVYADYNGTGSSNIGGGVSQGSGVSGGASWRKTGIVLYLLETDKGSVLTEKCAWLVPDGVAANNVEHDYFKTRIGEMSLPENPMGCDMPSPITWTGSAFKQNYSALHAWLNQGTGETIDSPDPKMYLRIVNKCFRKEYDEAVAQGKRVSLCIEGVAWHSLFYGIGENTGTPKEYISTAAGWAKTRKDKKVSGRTFTYKMDNIALPQLMKLEYRQFGWKTPFGYTYVSGEVTDDQILANGYGINIVNLQEGYSTATPTPAPAPKDENGTHTIVKVYEEQQPVEGNLDAEEPTESVDEWKVVGTYIQKNAPADILIADESKYEVTDWVSIKEDIPSVTELEPYEEITAGKSTVQSGSDSGKVLLTDSEKSLVIRLRMPTEEVAQNPIENNLTGDKVISESTISSGFTDSTSSLRFVYGSIKHGGCDGHTSGEGEKRHTSHCSWNYSVTDSDYTMKEINKNPDTSLIALTSGFKQYYSKATGHRTSASSGSDMLSNPRYAYTITRTGTDKLSLSDYWKNGEEIKGLVGRLSHTAAGQRKTQDYTQNLEYSLVYDPDVDLSTSVKWSGSHGCSDSGSTNSYSSGRTNMTQTVLFETYSGKDRAAGDEKPQAEFITSGDRGGENWAGTPLANTEMVRFNPTIMMKYNKSDNLDSTTEDVPVYVLSDHTRSFLPNDYVETCWTRPSSNNLEIRSNQFSSHARAVDSGKAWNGHFVLPGGATYQIENNTDQYLCLTTYHTIIAGNMKDISGAASYTTQRAEQEHKDIAKQVKDNLESLNIAQWVCNVNDNGSINFNAWQGSRAQTVERGKSLNLGNGCSQTSTDDKYYLNPSKEPDETGRESMTGEADLDVVQKDTQKQFISFMTDCYGRVLASRKMNSLEEALNTTDMTQILSKTQEPSDLTGDWVKIDQKTKIITNLCKAVERNTGDDYTALNAADGKWYNEAAPRIVLEIQFTTYDIGLYRTPGRMTILDPKLCPQNKGMDDLFSKANMVQYRCYDYCQTLGEGCTNEVGTLRGEKVYLNNMENFMFSNKIFVPNVNTQDLAGN